MSLAYISHVSLAPTKQWEGSGKRWVVCLGAFFLMAWCQCRSSPSHQTTDDLPTLSRYRVRVSSLSLHHADFFLPRHTNSFLLLPPPLCCASTPLSSTAMIARFSRLRRFFPSSFSFLAVLPPLLAIVITRRSFSFSSPAPPRSIRSDGVLSHLSFSLQRPASVFLKWLTVNFASWRACTRSHQAEDHVEPLSYAFAPDQCTGDLNEYKVREGITRYHSDWSALRWLLRRYMAAMQFHGTFWPYLWYH